MLVLNWLGWLSVGINSTLLPYFLWGFAAQCLRRLRPVLYAKWLLTVVAGIAGGVSLIMFILTFAVDGGSGQARPFKVSAPPILLRFSVICNVPERTNI